MRVSQPPRLALLPLAMLGALIFALALSSLNQSSSTLAAYCDADFGPSIVADREEYPPTETAEIEGCGFDDYIGQNLTLRITEPDLVEFTDTITPTSQAFFYYYVVPTKEGSFLVEVLDGSTVLASTTFLDAHSVNPSTLTFVAIQGSNPSPASQDFDYIVSDSCGGGTIAESISWLTTTPAAGSYLNSQYVNDSGSNKHLDVTATVTSNALALGTYTGTITMDASGSSCNGSRAVTVTLHVIKANPTLPASCGVDMVLVIDSSASVDSTELSQMQSALNSFVSAFLPNTPTQIAIVEFDTEATVRQGFTQNVTLLNNAINGAVSDNFTNWDDAINDSQALFPNRVANPDLIVFSSDGNPTYWGGNDGDPLTSDFGGGTGGPTALAKAIDEANAAKTAGTRMVTLGIGSELSTTNLAAISSPDAVVTSNFSTLATTLANLANDMCGGTITVQKILDADGNTGTTGDQTNAPGWTMNASVSTSSPNGDDTITPGSGVTDSGGQINFALTLGGNAQSIATVSEVLQANHTFISASCSGASNNGAQSGNGVSGIVVAPNNIVNCKIYNKPPAIFTVSKVWSPASGASVSVSVTCTSGTVTGGTQSVTTASPKSWTVTAFTGTPNCTATESPVPTGYIGSGSPAGTCSAALLPPAGACTITNTQRTAQVVVNKDFVPNNAANVTVSVTCTSGTVANDDNTASESDPANFTVTSWNAGATCTATESVPVGYAANESACANMALTQSGTATCTIVNTLNTANFNVLKDFVPNNAGVVNVSLSCASGTVTTVDGTAAEADDANFTVTGYSGNPTCTATESPIPTGYNSTGTCAASLTTGTCTIVNTLNSAQVVVSKDFSDNNAATVNVAVTCTTGTVANDDITASEADPANFTVTGFTTGATCTANETVPSGYTANQAACVNLAITHGGSATCTIVNTLNSASFNVIKDFSPNNAATVNVTLSCASGTVVTVDGTASEADDANFTVNGYTGNPTCTATESPIPTGYNSTGTCAASLTTGTCTILNTLNSAQVVVNKDFSDNNAANVTIAVTCTTGTVANDDTTASESDPANFTVTGFTAGATCTATETVPAGYTASQAACASMAISHGGTATCTITNTLNTASFNVIKDFSPNNAGVVNVTLSCASGTVVTVDGTAAEADDANFTVNGYTGNPTCTATESPIPTGYNSTGTCAAGLTTGTCTILNTLNSAQVVVNKDFSDNNAANVTVAVTCTTGTVANDDTTASESDPANFTVTGFTAGATCTATETVPAGYTASQATCANMAISHGGTATCTITNTLNTANFNVIKDFSDNSAAAVNVTLSCASGTVVTVDGTASEADDANFTVNGYTGNPTCTATESPIPTGYSSTGTCAAALATGTCTILNTLNTAAFNVIKDFSPNNAATVNVTLSCASGTVVTVDGTASEADDANFTVNGYTGNPTCTATESPIPTGYNSTGTCAASLTTGTCTILNTLNSAQVVVNKDFSDNNAANVTVAVTCTTGTVANDDTTASEADPANFTVTGFTAGATCTATETVPAGYTASQATCASMAISHGGTATCTIVNTLNSASFNVIKDFSPNNAATVNVTLSCASGTVVTVDGTASEADDANFTVNGYTGNPTCTATESPIPTGYNSTGTCAASLTTGTCTILNTLNSAQVVVNKDFSDNNAANVTVAVTCTTGTVANDDVTASEADPANFTVTGFTAGATCTATETVPAGYTASQATCANMAISHGGTATCTITNTLNTANFNVLKDFSDNNAANVNVSLSCASGTVVTVDGTASESDDANFTVNGYTGNPSCTATESPIPTGYTSTGTCTANLSAGTCTITNTLNTASFNVIKDFSPNNAASVNVTLSCATGTVVTVDGTASEADDANFTVNGFTGNPTCTATEAPIPAGYNSTGTCAAPLATGTCTILNTLNSAQVVVNKDFSDNNSADVTIAVTCTSGSVANDDVTASESDPANFTVTGFNAGATCTATEGVPAGYTANQAPCANVAISHGGTATCTITNTLNSASFNVLKDFVPNNAGTVNVTLSCASGTVVTVDGTASEADDANFTVNGYSGNPTCTATEAPIPTGYNSTGTCAASLTTGTCTIVNTLNSAQVVVSKDFSDNNSADVTIAVTCTTGTVANDDTTASESDPANFTVTGFTAGATCTATETVPAGYTANQAPCANVAISHGGTATCTITNTLNSAAFNVNKDFQPNIGLSVNVTLSCASGTVTTVDGTASEADDANFTVSGFSGDPSCTATEAPIPVGYNSTGTCTANLSAGVCTIVNALNSAQLVVNKDFSDNNPADVTIAVTCTTGSVANDDTTASESDPANFTITGFTVGATCTATETVPAGYTANQAPCALVLITIAGSSSCTITNTLNTANFNVIKDFSDNNPANVNVTLLCAAGTVTTVDGTASEADDANFTVSGFTGDPSCTATESPIPTGYTSTGTCAAALSAGTCTIVNTLRTAQVVVSKDFSDNNPANVTISVTCTSGSVANDDTTASESDPANFTVTGFNLGATCTATEGVPAGYTANQLGCALLPIVNGGTATCTITNTLNSANFNVLKDFSPNNAANVNVTLLCAVGTVTTVDGTASESDDANFTVTGFVGDPLCTATESPIPTGYSSTGVCAALLSAGTCTITNTLNSAQLIVNKDFSDNNPANVTIAVTCSTGTVANDDVTASESDPANFTITGFTPPAFCTATETVPVGYTASQVLCQLMAISVGGTSSCTITNVLNAGSFQVLKDFSDDDTGNVNVTLSCASGVAAIVDGTASEADPADFSVTGFSGDPTCTATESPVPAGYNSTGTCSAPLSAGQCTIVNTLRQAFLNVEKDFVPDDAQAVTITVTCSSGTVVTIDDQATEATPAQFQILGFDLGADCDATESPVPAGYVQNDSDCQNVMLVSEGAVTCTIVNTQNSATFNVNKDFVPNNGGTVNVTLSCASGTTVTVDGTASEADDANFTVVGYSGNPACTATESPIPAGYNSTGTCTATVSVNVCTIVNILNSAQVVVNKDFSDNNAANVTVAVTCTSGTVANDDTTASESDPANFTVTGFTAGATCTATETVPGGYVANQAGCVNVAITHGGTATCTITNTLNIANFNVNKDFVPNNGGTVNVTLSCASGTVSTVDGTASEADDANFTVSGFTGDPSCTATEAPVPTGYTSTGTCAAALSAGSCTIVNTLNSAQVVVNKDFSPNNAANVTVAVTCTTGTVANDDTTASEADPANFTVTGFTAGATCTATETVPAGYTASQATCANMAISHGGTATCTIVNTALPVNGFAVSKDFSDNSASNVSVTLSCTSGTVTTVDGDASESDTADFSVVGAAGGASCTATETIPPGYASSGTCTALVSVGTCTIVNNAVAQVVVNKDFADNNAANVTIVVTCSSGTVANDDQTASESDPANFTITGFGPGTTCTATESPVPAGYAAAQATCANMSVSAGGTATCTITNGVVLGAIEFVVNKDFTDANTADVTVSLFCTSGTATPDDATASEADPANFTVTGAIAGTTCTATENSIPGYVGNDNDCENVDIQVETSCTIVNTPGAAAVGGDVELTVLGGGDSGECCGGLINLLVALTGTLAICSAGVYTWRRR